MFPPSPTLQGDYQGVRQGEGCLMEGMLVIVEGKSPSLASWGFRQEPEAKRVHSCSLGSCFGFEYVSEPRGAQGHGSRGSWPRQGDQRKS